MITRLFESTPQHPLADPKELAEVVAGLRAGDPARLIAEIGDWFASLEQIDRFRADRLWQACTALDKAAQPALNRLTRDFLLSPPPRDAADRLVRLLRDEYCGRLAALYGRALAAARQRDRVGEALRPEAPQIVERLLATLGLAFKWSAFRHATPPAGLWRRLGDAYLAAVALGIDGQAATTETGEALPYTLAQRYLHVVVLAASSPDSLQPAEIELADRVIAHFLPSFAMAANDLPGMLYWVDASLDQPPLRLATLPAASPGVRLISPGDVHQAVEALLPEVQRGWVPESFKLGGLSSPRQVSRVLRHMARYWAPYPPMRAHQRHALTTALHVVEGFDACADRYDRRAEVDSTGSPIWHASDVSLGGLGVQVDAATGAGLRVGALVGMRPDGRTEWMIGAVRRLTRHRDGSVRAGIQTLSRELRLIEVRVRTAAGTLAPTATRALVLDKASGAGDLRLLLPGNTYDSRETLEAGRLRLTPLRCEDSGPDYDLAVYRGRLQP